MFKNKGCPELELASSKMAILFLEESLRKGNTIEIPILEIKIEPKFKKEKE